jgi:hypothetical protein
MESSTTKIDNIIDQLSNENYSGILKMIKKHLTKDPNQSPQNMFIIYIVQAYCQYNLHKYKQSENNIQMALKYFVDDNLNFYNQYMFLISIVLTVSDNDQLYLRLLDQLHETPQKVNTDFEFI